MAFKLANVLLVPPVLKDDGRCQETDALEATNIDSHWILFKKVPENKSRADRTSYRIITSFLKAGVLSVHLLMILMYVFKYNLLI